VFAIGAQLITIASVFIPAMVHIAMMLAQIAEP
jgi:hypothetical protein